ncbi:hypothetical protein EDD18DRAFT_1134556 [Armillaria luteobubalina]|uniref:Uncharacterized protein n=1 Tax=Armillaria luteobubalina TaxID=153913 RepID=A0AA39QGX7_9AGAR|nr:hypothetical protein EDD18DRAFT_1134556 [Armillaria luteobubalina]
MSLATMPSRGQCVQPIDNIHEGCQCSWFAPTLLDQNICGACGHGIHAHVDYVSMHVNHHPATQCAAFVQKTPLTQRCTCETWLSDHVTIDNLYRSADVAWNISDHAGDNDNPSSNVIGFSNDTINRAYTPSSISTSSTTFNTADVDPTPAPIFSPFISPHVFGSSGDATENMDLPPTPLFSPASSIPSVTQSHIVHTLEGYRLDDYFVHPVNSSYARQSDGDATDESAEYQYYSSNAMHRAPDSAGSSQYD